MGLAKALPAEKGIQFNISLETSLRWLSEDVDSFQIEVGIYEKFAKM